MLLNLNDNTMIGNVYTQYSILINMNERVCAYNSFYFHRHKAHCYNNIKEGKRTGIMRNGITI